MKYFDPEALYLVSAAKERKHMHSGLDTVLSTVIVQYVLTKSAVTIRLYTEDQNDMFSSLYVLNPTPGRSFGYFQNTGWLIIISWATSGIRGGLPVAEKQNRHGYWLV